MTESTDLNIIMNTFLVWFYESLDEEQKQDFRWEILDHIDDEEPPKFNLYKYYARDIFN